VCFDFHYNFCLKTFRLMRRIQQDMIRNVLVLRFHVKYFLLLLDFNETWIFWTHFRDMLIKFHGSPSSGNRVVYADGQTDRRKEGRTDGRTDRHDEANSHLLQFCERANKLLFVLAIATTVK
jgi:hypothetical protein